MDHGLFEEARQELEKALVYFDDLSEAYNNWGYFYHKIGEYENAAESFCKAIELNPDNFAYYNNMGFALYEAGRTEESLITLKKSLSIKEDQPEILRFIEEHLLAAEHLGGQNS
jgi:type IV pilus assembly protein PilF